MKQVKILRKQSRKLQLDTKHKGKGEPEGGQLAETSRATFLIKQAQLSKGQ